MSRTLVNALVLKNDGDRAILKPQDGSGHEITFRRGQESLREFLQMFPLQGMVLIFHPEDEPSPEEEVVKNWITVKVISNDGDEALLRLPCGAEIRCYRGDESQSDFMKAWSPGDMVEFKILGVQHGS